MSLPAIGVVIPCYKAEHTLRQTVESVLQDGVKCGYQEFFYPVGIVFEIIPNPADQSRRQSKPYARH